MVVKLLSGVVVVDVLAANLHVVERVFNRPLLHVSRISLCMFSTQSRSCMDYPGSTHNSAKHWVLAHTDDVSQTPTKGLAARGEVGGCLCRLADAEGTDDASPGGHLQCRRVNVVVGSSGNENGVGARLGNENGTRRVGSRVGHAADDNLSGPDSAGLVVIGEGRHTREVAGE